MLVPKTDVYALELALSALLVSVVVAISGGASAQARETLQVEAMGSVGAARRHPGSSGIRGSFAMVGANLAVTFDRETGNGLGLGGEASLVTLSQEMLWVGGYADATYATAAEELRVSVGPELGFSFAGIDLGYALKLGGERSPQHGISVRPLLSIGVATVYFRSIWLFGAHADWSAELGLLLKFPIELH